MKKSSKFYIFISIFLGFSAVGFSQAPVGNFYENTVSSTVCEGDSNIIKAGCSVAVGQVVRVTPGILTGVTVDKMGSCYEKYGQQYVNNPNSNIVVDLNDPCNQIAMFNPAMQKEKFAYIPMNEAELIRNSRPGIASLTVGMDIIQRQAQDGLIFNNSFYAAKTFENVPYLKTTFAATDGSGTFTAITNFVYEVWLLSRNIAYVILLVGALALGVVIMIGNQGIDKEGKTKLSVERAIPRVVIATILISSSYWIGSLILNTLVGGGITQGFAIFLSEALFPVDRTVSSTTGAQIAVYFSMSLATILFGVVAGLLATTGGAALIPIIIGIIYAFWKILLLYIYMLKNILDVLVYIIYSPFLLVGGVAPSDNSYKTFKQYANKLIFFVAYGFLLNLIIYGAKAIATYSTLQFYGDSSGTTLTAFESIASSYGFFSKMLVSIFGLIGFVYIIGLGKKAEGWATTFAEKVVKTKDKKKKKDEDED